MKKKLRIVISLFAGMETGRKALEELDIEVDKYYSSEIKPAAIKLAQFHYPDTIQLGSILNWKSWDIDYSKVDIILSGSPCKDLSIAGKRKGLNGANSGLFWTFIEILEHTRKFNPNVLFFQENVGSADIQEVRKISEALDILPVRFNSSLVTGFLRDRYYWTNIKVQQDWAGYNYTDIPQPEDKKIQYKDIIENGAVYREKGLCILENEKNAEYFKQENLISRYKKGLGNNLVFVDREKGRAILESESRPELSEELLLIRHKKGYKNIVFDNFTVRILSKIELCRAQGFPDDYCDILTRNQAASLLGDGWSLPMIEHFFSFIT